MRHTPQFSPPGMRTTIRPDPIGELARLHGWGMKDVTEAPQFTFAVGPTPNYTIKKEEERNGKPDTA